jgi:RimJ/RimL family protein N-acetyltransferase
MSDWTITQDVIRTDRLDLHHICAIDLITLFEDPEDMSIYDGKPYTNPHRQLMDDKGPLGWRVPQVKDNPLLNKWFVRWIVLRETGEIIGSTSFHAPPNADGMIEIGLGIHENFRNQGFAKESLRGMWEWVLMDPTVKLLRYTVSPTNVPSIRVVNSFGFELKGQQIDEEDGPEDIFEMTREFFLAKETSVSSE